MEELERYVYLSYPIVVLEGEEEEERERVKIQKEKEKGNFITTLAIKTTGTKKRSRGQREQQKENIRHKLRS